MKEIFCKTIDNVKIALNWYNLGQSSVLILCPGWFMTKDSKAFKEMAECFNNYFDVISMDFRGHGKSSGFYTFSSKETNDLETVVNFAKMHYKKVFLAGFSLGGGLVLIHGALQNNVDKIIAVSPPHSFEKIENQMWHKNAWLPTFKKFEPARWCSIRPSLLIHKKIKPIDIVNKISAPTLFIAGKKDKTVFPWHTEILFEHAVCDKKLEIFDDSIHAEDLFLDDKERFINLCVDWLNERN